VKNLSSEKAIAMVTIGNHPLENIIVEKGRIYKEMMGFLKDLHQEQIDKDQTSLSDCMDWIVSQYFLINKELTQRMSTEE
tara:strand:- start:1523 stop:1762 length:240 start_codon:yes stop_codon:yes gene_type:complete